MKTVPPWLRSGLTVLGLLLAAGAARAETANCPCPTPTTAAPAAGAAQAAATACPCPSPPPGGAGKPGRVQPAGTQLPDSSYSESYTAQRKPRVAVYIFDDTNKTASEQIYKKSVEAMLVTFLKRKSQLVVVERQRLKDIIDEWHMSPRTNLSSQDPSARELFEKIDALLEGSVTLLHAPSTIRTVDGKLSSGGDDTRIEVDVKALARSDGRIIAAAQSSGPVSCLRSIVERLGVALEQEFLRPYYGQLQFQMAAPANVRLFLTPILLDSALDVEKPPVERGESVLTGPERDVVEPWTTRPNSYTIQNLLTGWYTARLERPGYEGIGIRNGNEDWMARELGGRVQVFYTGHGERGRPPVPLAQAPEELRRFVVYVHPRDLRAFNGDRLGFGHKLGGSLAPVVKRQYLDNGFTHPPERVILIGKKGLEINHVQRPAEYAEDPTCDLFEERLPPQNPYGRTHVAAGESFDFDSFKGGDLILEDYQGETVPTGEYQIAFWEPLYQIQQGLAVVNDGDDKRSVPAVLNRQTVPVDVETTGPRLPYHMAISGETTGYRSDLPLAFGQRTLASLPVDRYAASTGIPGLRGWRGPLDLLPAEATPPVYDRARDDKLAEAAEAKKVSAALGVQIEEEEVSTNEKLAMPIRPSAEDERQQRSKLTPSLLRVKTRLCVGGRLAILSSPSVLDADDICFDPEIASLLDRAFEPEPEERQEQPRRWWMLGRRARPAAVEETAEPAAEQLHPMSNAGFVKPSLPPEEMDPPEAREQLASHLEMTDLLLLDDQDMDRLRENSEAAAVIARYVERGGAVFAFVAEPGDYREVIGTPFTLAAGRRRTSRFRLASGDVPGIELKLAKKRIRLGGRRKLLHPENGLAGGWRTVAYTTPGKGARILEAGQGEQGGYIVAWLDRPSLFHSRFRHRRVPAVEENRAQVEKLVLERIRKRLAARYDATGEKPQQAAQATGRPEERLQQLAELLRQGLITDAEYEMMRVKVLGSL